MAEEKSAGVNERHLIGALIDVVGALWQRLTGEEITIKVNTDDGGYLCIGPTTSNVTVVHNSGAKGQPDSPPGCHPKSFQQPHKIDDTPEARPPVSQ